MTATESVASEGERVGKNRAATILGRVPSDPGASAIGPATRAARPRGEHVGRDVAADGVGVRDRGLLDVIAGLGRAASAPTNSPSAAGRPETAVTGRCPSPSTRALEGGLDGGGVDRVRRPGTVAGMPAVMAARRNSSKARGGRRIGQPRREVGRVGVVVDDEARPTGKLQAVGGPRDVGGRRDPDRDRRVRSGCKTGTGLQGDGPAAGRVDGREVGRAAMLSWTKVAVAVTALPRSPRQSTPRWKNAGRRDAVIESWSGRPGVTGRFCRGRSGPGWSP